MLFNENLFPFNSLLGDKFVGVIKNNQINVQPLDSLLFQPFDIHKNNNFDPLNDVNPDKNFFNNFLQMFGKSCQYRTQKCIYSTRPLDYRISTKHKSNNYNVQKWGLGDICKDKKTVAGTDATH